MKAINAILEALASYLQLKVIRFVYEFTQTSREKQDALVNKIEMLRNVGDDNSNDVADVMRKQLIAEQEYLKHISAFGPQPPARDSSPNK